MRGQVHYEVFIKRAGGDWTLDFATEDRAQAIAAAEERLAKKKAASVKVTKETLDAETREFRTIVILQKGEPDRPKPRPVREEVEPLCVSPDDLYHAHSRERIGRLLEDWLARQRATPFELLHRPELVERLEASGVEFQHAIQKIALPEAHARDVSVHEMVRTFQSLAERTIERLMKDHRKGALPTLHKEPFAALAERLSGVPERAYLLGAAVAGQLGDCASWTEKVARLLDLADAAPAAGPPRALALFVIEQPLAEILGSSAALDDIVGRDLDLGARLSAMTRMSALEAVETLMRSDKRLREMMPTLSPTGERLARWLTIEDFEHVRRALARRVLRELNGPRRLRPDSAEDEIEVLRGLAMALTAASGTLVPVEEVLAAFTNRSRMLVTSDFVESYLGTDRTALQEAKAMIWLVENVIGAANKREACRWLGALLGSLKFEREIRGGTESPAVRMAALATLQRDVARAGLVPEDYQPIQAKLGELGGMLDVETRLTAGVARAQAPVSQRLMLLLRFATGEAAPLGPAADRAKAEALRLIRLDETRTELARSPERMAQVGELFRQAGMAA
ncbi:MAG: hypothetical protein WCY15_10615 [Phenylobacterium sp.]|jgi:hypothetical protein|uniref:hypothetical protein n=1 Tax=Phenylobacterium sp. TaxID=1871053 RepID=UPI002A35994C|nr:hypothetical protein [Phenylobacterium sp.]MDX9996935.1 hypothetical protein [Phenylobacterium sp.]